MRRALKLFYSDAYTIPLPAKHRFPMERYAETYRHMTQVSSLRRYFNISDPPATTAEDCQRAVHTQDFVQAFVSQTVSAQSERDIGFPMSQALVERTMRINGGTLAATMVALKEGVSGNMAGGTHHAFSTHPGGFCIFNDIALAARCVLDQAAFSAVSHFQTSNQYNHQGQGLDGDADQGQGHGTWYSTSFAGADIQRILVLDVDVHQGDGTAAIFQHDDRVFTFSIHGQHNYPFVKQRSDMDVELPDKCDDAAYLALLEASAARAIAVSRPQLVFVQAGVDGLASDRLGRLSLTRTGLLERNRLLMHLLRTRAGDPPVVLTMGGGYSSPITRSCEAHMDVFEAGLRHLNA